MNPKFLKRLKRFGAHYPQGPGLACFMSAEFTQIKALMLEMGSGAQLETYIVKAKELASDHPADYELSAMCPLHFRDLPANPYGARVAIGSLSLFVNDRSDVDGFLTLCLPIPAMEFSAMLLCGILAAEFLSGYSHGKAQWADMGSSDPGKN
jgi:hypothetical protein